MLTSRKVTRVEPFKLLKQTSLTEHPVPPKAQTRKRAREADKPLSGLNVDELLQREKRVKISPQNAIPEFKQTVANAANIEAIKDAADQMEKIIEDHIRNSFGDANYDRVVEELGVVRDEMIAYEEPGVYNAMIRRMKEKILAEKLGGDRKELWWLIRRAKVGLIHRGLSEKSDVTEDEAKAVRFDDSWIRINICNFKKLTN